MRLLVAVVLVAALVAALLFVTYFTGPTAEIVPNSASSCGAGTPHELGGCP